MFSLATQNHTQQRRFPSMESMSPIFRDFDSKGQTIPSKNLDLDKTARTIHRYCSHPVDFISEYQMFYGDFPEDIIQESPSYDPTNLYYSSNVCFVNKEKYSSPDHLYSEPKNNTYTLCPICDPFKPSEGPIMKKKIRDGKVIYIDQNKPQFYDTLHSEYDHHMAQVHGVLKTGVTLQPFVGYSMSQLTKTQKQGCYKLTSICPYNKRGTDEPCLAEFGFHYEGKSSNPYKSYFRHVHKHHFLNSKKDDDVKYQRVVQSKNGKSLYNVFIPLCEERFKQSLQHLQKSCSDSRVNPIKICEDRKLLDKVASYVSKDNQFDNTFINNLMNNLDIVLDADLDFLIPSDTSSESSVDSVQPITPQLVQPTRVLSPPPSYNSVQSSRNKRKLDDVQGLKTSESIESTAQQPIGKRQKIITPVISPVVQVNEEVNTSINKPFYPQTMSDFMIGGGMDDFSGLEDEPIDMYQLEQELQDAFGSNAVEPIGDNVQDINTLEDHQVKDLDQPQEVDNSAPSQALEKEVDDDINWDQFFNI